jgi:hypothetical protein
MYCTIQVLYFTEGEGLEPPWACARLISSQLPYQLGLALPGRKSSDAEWAPEAGLLSELRPEVDTEACITSNPAPLAL